MKIDFATSILKDGDPNILNRLVLLQKCYNSCWKVKAFFQLYLF
jgi:hypothetical protein